MNPDLACWCRFLGRVAAESTVILLALAALAARARGPGARAAYWKAALASVGCVLGLELAGARAWTSRPPPDPDAPGRIARLASTRILPAADPRGITSPFATDGGITQRTPSAPEGRVDWWPAVVWAIGTGMLLARMGGARILLRRRRRSAGPVSPATSELLARLSRQLGAGRVTAGVWPGIPGPLATGWIHPHIGLPPDFESRFGPEQRAAMLAHEVAHLAARDPRWLGIGDLVAALAWWHPAVWWARHRCRTSMELAADAASACVPGGRLALAEALLDLARGLAAPRALRGLGILGSGSASPLAERVRALLGPEEGWSRPKSALRTAGLAGILAAIGLHLPAWPETETVNPFELLLARVSRPVAEFSAAGAGTSGPSSSKEPVSEHAVAASPSLALEPPPAPGPERGTPSPLGSSVPPATTTTPAPVGAVGLELPTARFRDARVIADSGSPEAPVVSVEVKVLEVSEQGPEDLGLDWLFGQSATNDAPPVIEVPTGDLPGADSAYAQQYRLHRRRVEGQIVTLSDSQTRVLISSLERRGGVELMSAPRATMRTGQKAQISITEMRTIVAGVEVTPPRAPTEPPNVNYRTEVLPVGTTVDIVAARQGGAWRVEVAGRLTDLLGYEDPNQPRADGTPPATTNSVVGPGAPGGSPWKAQVPLPYLRVREVVGHGLARPGESLLLRGPVEEPADRQKVPRSEGGKPSAPRRRLYFLVTPLPG